MLESCERSIVDCEWRIWTLPYKAGKRSNQLFNFATQFRLTLIQRLEKLPV